MKKKRASSARVSSALASRPFSGLCNGHGAFAEDNVDESDEEDLDGGSNGEPGDAIGVVVCCYTLFIDGISSSVDYHQVRDLFQQHGKVKNLFIQRQRNLGRRFRFGFAALRLRRMPARRC